MRDTMYILLLTIALFMVTSANNPGEPELSDHSQKQTQMITKDDFPTFWIEFRKAIISMDYVKLIEMTSFPLKCLGKWDSDPQFRIGKDRFYYFFKTCLSEETGRTTEGETNLDYIKRTSVLEEDKDYTKNKNRRRVGAMEFQKINSSWKLALIYFDTANYNEK